MTTTTCMFTVPSSTSSCTTSFPLNKAKGNVRRQPLPISSPLFNIEQTRKTVIAYTTALNSHDRLLKEEMTSWAAEWLGRTKTSSV